MNTKKIIIAEAGVNHNGSLDMAKQLINVAAEAGADYVKFQTFDSKLGVTSFANKADYQLKNTGKNESNMLKNVT
jgi:N,N'-diacetyllegionaminate synthase